jgi:hypothetical protein
VQLVEVKLNSEESKTLLNFGANAKYNVRQQCNFGSCLFINTQITMTKYISAIFPGEPEILPGVEVHIMASWALQGLWRKPSLTKSEEERKTAWKKFYFSF